ncbi:uncharacterized protein LOC131883108 isoform X1 [Tigriopus californicus]|uniref:uncharacterized protein LOC131883108 isoform X1 n=2 Tax=Tigriopus californicus TaxID=6832 RepID=UPI0027DA0AC7|nr:uncharacterized protein LOC131883108 isoform X1 [Tigriopus californicus]
MLPHNRKMQGNVLRSFFGVAFLVWLEGSAANERLPVPPSVRPEGFYCHLHENHTLCRYQNQVSSTCGQIIERGMTQQERELVLMLHNERRAFIANGKELRGDPGPQPPAANMMELTYDEELEFEAQSWADQCIRNHECPQCRSLDRFKVGQNLFWFGHFSGSWEKSVKGWYDEVVDFNSSFVFPFYVIPGVLVGHFTQMTWSSSTKMGCGKLISQPENSNYGQQFFICNYGLAGNLIKSEMYKVGQPCSDCPRGTTCSLRYPGLCNGVPTEKLTVRTPVNVDLSWIPTRPPIVTLHKPNEGPKLDEVLELPPIIVEPPEVPDTPEECIYTCQDSGGCSVKFASIVFFSGSVLGSCFPPSFGGECSGTPEKCEECIGICNGKNGQELTVTLSKGNSSSQIVSNNISETKVPNQESAGSGDTCSYNCQSSGGCSVRINSKGFVSGSVLGSCFSPGFGGKCSGTPTRCQDCLGVCQELTPGEHVRPVSI